MKKMNKKYKYRLNQYFIFIFLYLFSFLSLFSFLYPFLTPWPYPFLILCSCCFQLLLRLSSPACLSVHVVGQLPVASFALLPAATVSRTTPRARLRTRPCSLPAGRFPAASARAHLPPASMRAAGCRPSPCSLPVVSLLLPPGLLQPPAPPRVPAAGLQQAARLAKEQRPAPRGAERVKRPGYLRSRHSRDSLGAKVVVEMEEPRGATFFLAPPPPSSSRERDFWSSACGSVVEHLGCHRLAGLWPEPLLELFVEPCQTGPRCAWWASLGSEKEPNYPNNSVD
ncbi:hypothetical protein PVAP13_2NG262109 [Panicum virgatum]|uniref:Uncharacterized protein n=1 Tax=Panicum virgatum TaxID=38727 RepID=A0A8T0VI28_PANVG|nr:hypothetical protein PVAP13_2NG262109 [Panicum virgatum]